MSADKFESSPGAALQEALPPDDDESKPPDGGYGWVCVFACFLINGFTWGTNSAFGVYLSYYQSHLVYPGASRLDFAWVGGVNVAAAFVVAPFMNLASARLPLRAIMYLGCVVLLAGWIVASFATTFWQLCVGQGLLAGLGIGMVWIPSMYVVPQWFEKRRSLANGIGSGGTGFGGVIFSLITTPMIEHISLPWALRISGLVAFSVLLVSTTLTRDRNRKVQPDVRVFDLELLKNVQVLLLLGWGFLFMLGYPLIVYCLGTFALTIGATQSQAGIVVACMNIGMALGRPLFGKISDHLGRITTTTLYSICSAIFVFVIWIPCNNYGLLIFYALLFGATGTIYNGAVLVLSAEVAGLKKVPSMASISWLSVVPPTLVCEVIAFALRQRHMEKQFLYAQLFAALTYIAAALCLVELRRRKHGLRCWEKHGLTT